MEMAIVSKIAFCFRPSRPFSGKWNWFSTNGERDSWTKFTQIWVVMRDQYGISALVSQTSFGRGNEWYRRQMSTVFSGSGSRFSRFVCIYSPFGGKETQTRPKKCTFKVTFFIFLKTPLCVKTMLCARVKLYWQIQANSSNNSSEFKHLELFSWY